ncbi:MAG: type II toxin-antitoxin system PemK/MazF family toxin [Gemmataceae bacterium]
MIKGKVVLVPFPFDDLSGTKVRPAVCLTDAIGHHRHVVLAFLTTQAPSFEIASDLTLDSSHPDFAATGLRFASTLRLHRLMTAVTSIIQRELGQLSPSLQLEIDTRLRGLFGL